MNAYSRAILPVPPPEQTDSASQQSLVDEPQFGSWQWDFARSAFSIDAPWCRAMGLDPCVGDDHLTRWMHGIHPDDVNEYRRRFEAIEVGNVDRFEVEYRIFAGDSRWLWVLQRGRTVEREPDGRARRVTGICLEIDERKRAEVASQENEARLATALWGAQAAFWQWHFATDVTLMSPLWFAMTGYTREQWDSVPNPWFSRIHPDDLERIKRQISEHLTGQSLSMEIEYRLRTAAGEWKWMLTRGRTVEWDFDGNATAAIGVSLDIDAQKRAETELRSSEARLETAVWGAGMGLWEMDFRTESTRWFSDWCARLELFPCDGGDHVARWDANIHPDDVDDAARRFSDHVAGKEDHYDAEYRIRDRHGNWRWLFERGRVVERAPDGQALRMVGICMDIDRRKDVELASSRTQQDALQTYAAVLAVMHQGVLLLDADGTTIRLTNPAFDTMLGVAAGELAGTSVESLFSVRIDRRRFEGGLYEGDFSEALLPAEFECQRRDGAIFPVACVSSPLDLGARRHWLLVLTDLRQVKRLEREIIDVANREQQRIGSDLHDGLGQDLTGIALMLRGVVAQLRKNGSNARLDVEDVIGLVNAAIENTRALARGLSPVGSERGGLLKALNMLIARVSTRYGVQVDLQSSHMQSVLVGEQAATHLYRITQEAITNVIRHSRATQVVVRAELVSDVIHLRIEDNGRGFTAPGVSHGEGGLGLKIMRYRARMLSGEITFEPSAMGGLCVHCWCPVEPAAGSGDHGSTEGGPSSHS